MNAPAELLVVDRRRFIGGSDAAAIFGVSPWSTPLDIYLKKRGEMQVTGNAPDPQRERILKRGKRLEPIVVDMLIEEHGIEVTKRSTPEQQNYHYDPEHGFLASEIDFEWKVTAEVADRFALDPALIGTIQNGEIKTVHPFAAGKFGEDETDEIPIEYAAQAMHGLMVTGRELCMFGVLVGADNLLVYWIKRDAETIAAMREKELRFWRDNVMAGVPPEPVNLTDIYHLFNRKESTKVYATPEIAALARQYALVGDQVKAFTAQQEEIKFQIGKFMLGGELMDEPAPVIKHELLAEDGKPLMTVAYQTQDRVDNDKLTAQYPEVKKDCIKTSKFFVFRLTRRKK